MSKEELIKLREKTLELYIVFEGLYAEQAGRGPRPGLDKALERSYDAFFTSNEKLPKEHKIKPAFKLTYVA